MGKRICSKCEEEKILTKDFYKDRTQVIGYSYSCKECDKKRHKVYKDANKEKQLAQHKKWWEANPKSKLYHNAKKRAKNKGWDFTITVDDITIPKKCPVLGIPLEHGKKYFSLGSPSLDRVDNTKGYTPDNIKVISWRANSIKGDATVEEIEKVFNWLKKEICQNENAHGEEKNSDT